MNIIDNDLLSIQEARIIAENAREAQRQLAEFSSSKLDHVIEMVSNRLLKEAEKFAKASVDETDYGRWEDKYFKNRFVCETLARKLKAMHCLGVVSKNYEERTFDVGVSKGVILAFLPATSPVATAIYNALIAIKSGNAIVFYPSPRAKKVSSEVLDLICEVAETNGLPTGAIGYMHTLSDAGAKELMNHSVVSDILITCTPEFHDLAFASGKPVICGSMGNNPVFVERTADLRQAAKDIVDSKSFDYGILPGVEQSVVVDAPVADKLRQAMETEGAYFMNANEAEQLAVTLFDAKGEFKQEMIGKSAQKLAYRAGFSVDDRVRILVAQEAYVSRKSPFLREKYAPVLTWYVEDDWQHACEKCIELLISEKDGHSLAIFSADESVIHQFALKKPVGRLLINTPCALGSTGLTTNLFPAMSLGNGSTGRGITVDNVSPLQFIYTRKIAYGVRNMDKMMPQCMPNCDEEQCQLAMQSSENITPKTDVNAVYELLKKMLAEGPQDLKN